MWGNEYKSMKTSKSIRAGEKLQTGVVGEGRKFIILQNPNLEN